MNNIFDSFLVNKYIAHRGYHNEQFPENSLGAFQNAIDNNYAIELDVHMIADGTLAVFHDDTLSRMTGKDGYIKSLNNADLKSCFLGGTKYCIPTFKEVLLLVAGKTPLLIEIKTSANKIGKLEEKLMAELKDYNGEFAVQSFSPFIVNWFKVNAPQVLRGQLAGYLKKERLPFYEKFALKRMMFNKKCEPDFINYEAEHLNSRFLKKFKNLPLLCYVIRSEADFFKAVKRCDNMVFENIDIKNLI